MDQLARLIDRLVGREQQLRADLLHRDRVGDLGLGDLVGARDYAVLTGVGRHDLDHRRAAVVGRAGEALDLGVALEQHDLDLSCRLWGERLRIDQLDAVARLLRRAQQRRAFELQVVRRHHVQQALVHAQRGGVLFDANLVAREVRLLLGVVGQHELRADRLVAAGAQRVHDRGVRDALLAVDGLQRNVELTVRIAHRTQRNRQVQHPGLGFAAQRFFVHGDRTVAVLVALSDDDVLAAFRTDDARARFAPAAAASGERQQRRQPQVRKTRSHALRKPPHGILQQRKLTRGGLCRTHASARDQRKSLQNAAARGTAHRPLLRK